MFDSRNTKTVENIRLENIGMEKIYASMILENSEEDQKCIVGNQFVTVIAIVGEKEFAKKEDAKEVAKFLRIAISTM